MADGANVSIVYSPFDAVNLAQKNPDKTIVFLGVGFETTAPTIAATVQMAHKLGLKNFKVLSFHKLVPPALRALMADNETRIDAFILPGHVSTIIGMEPYRYVADEFHRPAVITGFEPLDILQSLIQINRMRKEDKPDVINQYKRAVSDHGNPKAMEIMFEVFEPKDGMWRGIGTIPESGLEFQDKYKEFDAKAHFGLEYGETPPLPGCKCGQVLKGIMTPPDCPLFKKACTPQNPVGPCMVSTEGSCAAYFKYNLD